VSENLLTVAHPVLWIRLREQLCPQISRPVSVLLKLPFSGFFLREISFSLGSAPARFAHGRVVLKFSCSIARFLCPGSICFAALLKFCISCSAFVTSASFPRCLYAPCSLCPFPRSIPFQLSVSVLPRPISLRKERAPDLRFSRPGFTVPCEDFGPHPNTRSRFGP
jgi:hypothetical protein